MGFNKKILLFAGTTEGRLLCEFFAKNNIAATVCVATEYGKAIIEENSSLNILSGRLSCLEMEKLIKDNGFNMVVDSTHPFAKEVTENIATASTRANVEYVRILREQPPIDENLILVDSIAQCVDYLQHTEGKILVATGSKEISAFAKLNGIESRVIARVLPTVESISACLGAGVASKNIVAMQGPFSEEMNIATINQYNCSFMVTKLSGNTGGLAQKLDAAKAAKVTLVAINLPQQKQGYLLQEFINRILSEL